MDKQTDKSFAEILDETINATHTTPNAHIGENVDDVIMYSTRELAEFWKECSHNKKVLKTTPVAGCFSCEQVINPKSIDLWVDVDDTAVCPYCGIDSIIPFSPLSNYPVQKAILGQLCDHYM